VDRNYTMMRLPRRMFQQDSSDTSRQKQRTDPSSSLRRVLLNGSFALLGKACRALLKLSLILHYRVYRPRQKLNFAPLDSFYTILQK
jgi:hypothetical protein